MEYLCVPVCQTTHPGPAVSPNPTVASAHQWAIRTNSRFKSPQDIALVLTGQNGVHGDISQKRKNKK